MNPISTFIEPLGWALLHFLWQGAVIALLLRGFLWLTRRRSPQVRYAAAGAALLLMLGAAVGTVRWQWRGMHADIDGWEEGEGCRRRTARRQPAGATFAFLTSFPYYPFPAAGSSPAPRGPASAAHHSRPSASPAAVDGGRVGGGRLVFLAAAVEWLARRPPMALVCE